MKKSIIEKAHDFILKMPSFLEKIVTAIIGELQPQLSAMIFLWNWARRFILMIHVHVVLEKSIRSVVGDKKFIVTNIEVIFA